MSEHLRVVPDPEPENEFGRGCAVWGSVLAFLGGFWMTVAAFIAWAISRRMT